MNEDLIRAELDKIRESCDEIDTLLGSDSNVINVYPGDNLASMIESAPADTIFRIQFDYETDADLVLTKPVQLKSSKIVTGRAAPSDIMPTIHGSLVSEAAAVLNSIGITGVKKEGALVVAGDNLSLLACVIHGSLYGQHRGIFANSNGLSVIDSWVGNIFGDIDTQALAGWDGSRNWNIKNSYLEASGENILLGGADSSSEANIPENIIIDSCDLSKPLVWKDDPSITCKNLFEIKNAKKVKMINCNLANSWRSGQTGYAIVLTVRNQDGNNPYACIEDVEIIDCDIDNVGAGIQILGQDYSNPSGFLDRLLLSKLRFLNVDGANGAGIQVFFNRGSKHITMEYCEFYGANINSFFTFDDPTYLNENLSIKDCLFQEGEYGIKGTNAPLGTPALDMYAPGYKWADNKVKLGGFRTIPYPAGTILIP